MLNFREFEAGPDPFGRKFQVWFKWMQTGISLRHADTVDVKFVLLDQSGEKTEKTIAMEHADLRRLAADIGRNLDDPWCCRLAAMHLRHLIETAEDLEKTLVTINPADLRRYAEELTRTDREEVHAG